MLILYFLLINCRLVYSEDAYFSFLYNINTICNHFLPQITTNNNIRSKLTNQHGHITDHASGYKMVLGRDSGNIKTMAMVDVGAGKWLISHLSRTVSVESFLYNLPC